MPSSSRNKQKKDSLLASAIFKLALRLNFPFISFTSPDILRSLLEVRLEGGLGVREGVDGPSVGSGWDSGNAETDLGVDKVEECLESAGRGFEMSSVNLEKMLFAEVFCGFIAEGARPLLDGAEVALVDLNFNALMAEGATPFSDVETLLDGLDLRAEMAVSVLEGETEADGFDFRAAILMSLGFVVGLVILMAVAVEMMGSSSDL